MDRKLKLSILNQEDGYSVSVEDVSGYSLPVKLEKKTSVSSDDRTSLIAGFNLLGQIYGSLRGETAPANPGELIWSRLEISGKRLYSKTLPHEVRDTINMQKEANIIIDSNDSQMPFELYHDGENFLCLKYPMGRQVRTEKRLKIPDIIDRKKIKVAVVCDPTGDLPEARNEGKKVKNILEKSSIVSRVDFICDKEAKKARLEEVLSGGYDIIHYAGHIDYDSKDPSNSSFRLNDGPLSAKEVQNILTANPLVFANACTSARSPEGLEGMAAAFVHGGGETDGVIGYIGSAWPIHDDSSSYLAEKFYGNLSAGESIGESLRIARKSTLAKFGKEDSGWASFLLYGDPARKLITKIKERARLYAKNPWLFYSNTLFFGTFILGGLLITSGILVTLLGGDFTYGSASSNLGGVGILLVIISLPLFGITELAKRFVNH